MKLIEVNMKKIKWIGMLLPVMCLGGLVACHKQDASQQNAALPVSVIKVLKTDLPWNIEYPAQVAGSLQIQVRAQVGGILKARLFDEGAYVEQGTQLFQIDPQEYEVALERANATMSQAQTDVNRTHRDYERMKKLRADNAVSQKDYDDSLSAYEAAQAALKIAQAGVNNAKINLEYTKVLAPISGITGKEAQSVGSLISPSGNGLLTTMVQIQPLWVNFSMPSAQFYKLAEGYLDGTITIKEGDDKHSVYVQAITSDGRVYPEKGSIIFFDSTEDIKTSSLAMRAEFPNPTNKRMLMPGQFVRVRLIGATYKDAVLIPSSAVLSTPTGNLVYIVQSDNTLKAQPITAQLQDDMYIVTEGLKGGETIVSEGLIKVRPDMKVTTQLKEFSLPVSHTPTATDVDITSFDQAMSKEEKPDTQVLPDAIEADVVTDTDKNTATATPK